MEEYTADELSGGCRGPSIALQSPARHPRLPWVRVHQVLGPLLRLLVGVAFICVCGRCLWLSVCVLHRGALCVVAHSNER